MRFALLSANEDALRLAHAAANSPHHSLVAAYDCDSYAAELNRLGVGLRSLGDWERLLHDPDCEAVIVGNAASEAERYEYLRKLVQSSVPLVVVHPICDMLLGFELQMIQRDSHSAISPYFPGLASNRRRVVRVAKDSNSPLGKIQQVTLERRLATVDQSSVQYEFARDALLFRLMLGRIDRLGALGAQPYPAEDWGNLSVHMTSGDGVIARWTAAAIPDQTKASRQSDWDDGELTIVGAKGKLVCAIHEGVWEVREDKSNVVWNAPIDADSLPSDLEAAQALDEIEAATGDVRIVDQLWDDACRAGELSDTVEASYRRGKTIELFHEEHTEEETFKSMMAAGGCLALLLTLIIIPLFAVIESLDIPWLESEGWEQMPWRLIYWRNWPIYLFALLAVFLGLQTLRMVFRSDSD